ncbi:hypothetical protein I7I48_01208 [Histoplasma ohiense]|nr:hypothetical protein I7I48_01208 [Histoplasma ohiense (nom. inval.)]
MNTTVKIIIYNTYRRCCRFQMTRWSREYRTTACGTTMIHQVAEIRTMATHGCFRTPKSKSVIHRGWRIIPQELRAQLQKYRPCLRLVCSRQQRKLISFPTHTSVTSELAVRGGRT